MAAMEMLERLRSPAEVRVTVPAPPDAVFAVLSDPETYPDSEVRSSEEPTRLVLDVHAGPVKGVAEYELERIAEGTLVTLREQLTGALEIAMPLARGPIFLRNRMSLDKLRKRFEPLVVRL